MKASEDYASQQFLHLAEFLQISGYEHYEVSNFAKRGFFIRNTIAVIGNKSHIWVLGPLLILMTEETDNLTYPIMPNI